MELNRILAWNDVVWIGYAQRFTGVISGSALFTKWRKAGMLRVSQGQYKDKKRPYVARILCATQGLIFYF